MVGDPSKRKGPSGNCSTEIGRDMLHKHAKMYLDRSLEARCIKSFYNCSIFLLFIRFIRQINMYTT